MSAAHAESPGFQAHATACIDAGAVIGAGTRIWHYTHVMPDTVIGRNCNLGQNVVVSPGCRLGDNVKVQNNVSIYSGVVIEDDVFCGPSMVFTNVINPRSHIARKHEYRDTLVRRGASIGANATVVCGHTLGRYCFIGAGAVVTRDVPDYGLVYGNPARLHGHVCYCGEKLPVSVKILNRKRIECKACQRAYSKRDGKVHPLEESE
jgi:UDP-2-acetamido-3-amino-2,3-dideoxy-glucuronate N-acetyltransferase